MKLEVSRLDKILSIINSGLGILVILFSALFKPEYLNFALIVAFILIAITIIALSIKVYFQSKRISKQSKRLQELEDTQKSIQNELQTKEQRIAQLEHLINVPFFKKWNLLYTFMWRNAIPYLSNDIEFYEAFVTRKLVGPGRLKDNHVKYVFWGECQSKLRTFHFCVAGADNIPLEKISFKAFDLFMSKELEYRVIKNTPDSNFKYVDIYFREEKSIGDVIKLELSWEWPKTAFSKSDYFSFPNIFSHGTRRIILELYPTDNMQLSSVDTYKFGLPDKDPVFLEHTYKNSDGYFRTIINNPEQNADYITYYG